LRIFLDTNVWASALLAHGLCRDLLDRIVIDHTVLLGGPVREELHRVLTSRFGIPSGLWRELEVKLRDFEQVPSTTIPLNAPAADADDVIVLACALAAQSDAFVTGDKALLKIGEIEGVPIVSPRQLWQRLAGSDEQERLA
jgi:uncharacterized protein